MAPKSLNINRSIFMYIRKCIAIVVLMAFMATSIQTPAYAVETQNFASLRLPAPGVRVGLSPEFTPAHLKGLVIHPENPLKFDFIIYKGDESLSDQDKQIAYKNLIKYFMASLAVPDENQWVNLSPYEKNRIVEEDFGKTEMGRDLLAQDYLLKQITASLIYPEDELGKKFWDKVYTQAQQQFGSTEIPVNTFNKVWIVPDDATVYESGNTAYVLKNHLKVMLEADYMAMNKNAVGATPRGRPQEGQAQGPAPTETNQIGSQIVREIVLPALEKEVNEGKNFAMLRQVYSGMILAAWYKRALKESLLGKIYADKAKVNGINQDPKNNEAIYQQYLKAYKKGVFNYIKEDTDKFTHQPMPRKYFSGGTKNEYGKAMRTTTDSAMARPIMITEAGKLDAAEAVLAEKSEADAAMVVRANDKLVLEEEGIYSVKIPNLGSKVELENKKNRVILKGLNTKIFASAQDLQVRDSFIKASNILDTISIEFDNIELVREEDDKLILLRDGGAYYVSDKDVGFVWNEKVKSQVLEAVQSLRQMEDSMKSSIGSLRLILYKGDFIDSDDFQKKFAERINTFLLNTLDLGFFKFKPENIKIERDVIRFLGIRVASINVGLVKVEDYSKEEFANALADYLTRVFFSDMAMATAVSRLDNLSSNLEVKSLPKQVRIWVNKNRGAIDVLLNELVAKDYVKMYISKDKLESFQEIVRKLKEYPVLTRKLLDEYSMQILSMFSDVGPQAGTFKKRFRDFLQEDEELQKMISEIDSNVFQVTLANELLRLKNREIVLVSQLRAMNNFEASGITRVSIKADLLNVRDRIDAYLRGDAAMSSGETAKAMRQAIEDLRDSNKKDFEGKVTDALLEEIERQLNTPEEFMASIAHFVYAYLYDNYQINMLAQLNSELKFENDQFLWFGVPIARVSSDKKGISVSLLTPSNVKLFTDALSNYLEKSMSEIASTSGSIPVEPASNADSAMNGGETRENWEIKIMSFVKGLNKRVISNKDDLASKDKLIRAVRLLLSVARDDVQYLTREIPDNQLDIQAEDVRNFDVLRARIKVWSVFGGANERAIEETRKYEEILNEFEKLQSVEHGLQYTQYHSIAIRDDGDMGGAATVLYQNDPIILRIGTFTLGLHTNAKGQLVLLDSNLKELGEIAIGDISTIGFTKKDSKVVIETRIEGLAQMSRFLIQLWALKNKDNTLNITFRLQDVTKNVFIVMRHVEQDSQKVINYNHRQIFDLMNLSRISGKYIRLDYLSEEGMIFNLGRIDNPDKGPQSVFYFVKSNKLYPIDGQQIPSNIAEAVSRYNQNTNQNPDGAMRVADQNFNKGGIDFNAANLNLQIKRDGAGVPLPISQQDLENIHIEGLVPIIIDIKPAVSLPMFSQLQESTAKV